MDIPLLDLKAQLRLVGPELQRAVSEVIDSTRYILGPRVEELEEAIADYVGVGHAVGVSSGTDALLAALMALEIGPGDVVVTTPYSFFATAGAVARLGARPVFVDVDPRSYNLDPEALRAWLERGGEAADRVRAILPVHLYGQCADMEPILALAGERGIPVVEDAAQAIGARYASGSVRGRAGALGTLGCFSFFPSKNLGGIGDGGMVVTDDPELADRLRRLRVQGARPKYHHALVGGNFRLDPVQAAALLVKLPHLEGWNRLRRERAAFYDAQLELPGIETPALSGPRDHHCYHAYVISLAAGRDALRQRLDEEGIGNAVYYPLPLHEQECFRQLGYARGDLPHSEYASQHSLAIPVYPELTPEMQRRVVQVIREFHEQAGLRRRSG